MTANPSLPWISDFGKRPLDLLILVALPEELDILLDGARSLSLHGPELNAVYHLFDAPTRTTGARYRCAATLIGEMGPTAAAVTAERAIGLTKPFTMINIGIAARLSNDLGIGDIVLGDVVDDYICSARANAESECHTATWANIRERVALAMQTVLHSASAISVAGLSLSFAGRPYVTSREYWPHADSFAHMYPEIYVNWADHCCSRLDEFLDEHKTAPILADLRKGRRPVVRRGHVASGPIVSGAPEYKELLRRRDRKFLALEMEAAGVMAASEGRQMRTLVIKGISDGGDRDKNALEQLGDGFLRKHAMRNACEFLWAFLDIGILPRASAHDERVESEQARGTDHCTVTVTSRTHRIAFSYLPEPPTLHGWTLALDTPGTTIPTFSFEPYATLGQALVLHGPEQACLDYRVPDVHRVSTAVEFTLAEYPGEKHALYVQVEILDEGHPRPVWLIIHAGKSAPIGVGDGVWEWHYYVPPTSREGDWIHLRITLADAVDATFGTQTAFSKLLGFRIRGSVRIAAIDLFRQAA